MAGTLLLVNRSFSSSDWNRLCDHIGDTSRNIYGDHLSDIKELAREESYFLLAFSNYHLDFSYLDHAGNRVIIDGHVFHLEEARGLSPKELLAMYLDSPNDFASQLDGHFVIKIWYKASSTWHVFTDIIKYKSNFYVETEECVMFTPFAATCGAITEVKVDPYALNEFMWRYYIMSHRSMLTGVSKCEPATHYEITSAGLSMSRYWDFPHQFSGDSFEASVEKMQQSMTSTMTMLDDTFGGNCLDFTMGQDTRFLVSAQRASGRDFKTSIFGKDEFFEVEDTLKLAEKHAIDHHVIQLEEDYLNSVEDYFKKAVLLTSCEEPGYIVGRILYMRERQRALGNCSINGAEGQFYKNGLWDEHYMINFYRDPGKFKVDLFLSMRALSKNYEDSHFSDDFLAIKANSRAYIKDIIEGAIASHVDAPTAIHTDRFDIYYWLNYAATANNACDYVIPAFSPMLLRRNFEQAIAIPVQWKFNLSKYMRAVVYGLDPALAAEKNDWAGVNMVPKKGLAWLPFYAKYFWAQSKRFRKKIGTKMGWKKTTALQSAWDYRPLFEDLVSSDWSKSLLDDNPLLEDLLKPPQWIEYTKEVRTSGTSLHKIENYMKLMSVEYFLTVAKKYKWR